MTTIGSTKEISPPIFEPGDIVTIDPCRRLDLRYLPKDLEQVPGYIFPSVVQAEGPLNCHSEFKILEVTQLIWPKYVMECLDCGEQVTYSNKVYPVEAKNWGTQNWNS